MDSVGLLYEHAQATTTNMATKQRELRNGIPGQQDPGWHRSYVNYR